MAFDFIGLNPVYPSLYAPRILGRSRTIENEFGGSTQLGNRQAERNEFSESGQRQRLAELAQRDALIEDQQKQRELFEMAKREKEKEEYAKWEREQILNAASSELFSKRGTGTYIGKDSKGNKMYQDTPLSQAEQYIAAAKKAAEMGKGAYAQEFMATAQGIAQKEQKARQEAEQTRLENEYKQKQIEAQEREAANPKLTPVTDNEGNISMIDPQGNVVKTIVGAGKPSATFEKTQAAKKKLGGDIDLAISELQKAVEDGGLIDQSTGSGVGALADTAASFFGQATPGAIATAKMKPIYDLALKMVPRFEGPQSDKDTLSYREAAGQLADPAIPSSIKKEAAKVILELMQKRKGQFTGQAIEGTENEVTTGSSLDVPPPGAVRKKK